MLKHLMFFISFLSFCTYDPQPEKEAEVSFSFKKMGYNENNVFIYALKHIDSNNTLRHLDTLALFMEDVSAPQYHWDKLMEWQFVKKTPKDFYDFDSERVHNSHTGITLNDSFLMIHPTRFNYLTDLQHCPYPYFYFEDSIGCTWGWDFVIGTNWTTDLYPIKDTETFYFRYQFADTQTLSTPMGLMFCRKIMATASSSFGISKAEYYLNADYGLVKYHVTDIDKSQYFFELIVRDREDAVMNPDSPKEAYRKKRKGLSRFYNY